MQEKSRPVIETESNKASVSLRLARWGRTALGCGLIAASCGACAQKIMYKTEGIVETIFKQSSQKGLFLQIGQSREEHGCTITPSAFTSIYGSDSRGVIIEIYGKTPEEEFMMQVSFKSGDTRDITFSDGTVLRMHVGSIREHGTNSEAGASVSVTKIR